MNVDKDKLREDVLEVLKQHELGNYRETVEQKFVQAINDLPNVIEFDPAANGALGANPIPPYGEPGTAPFGEGSAEERNDSEGDQEEE